ncbi:MAG: hypothetical protein F4Z28_11880 [Gammaproteobacteria bacterium]|nr:hypothetical protein [Gammaproteobacteria bacterium]
MDPVEFDHYLRTGVDLRRLAQTAGGEWLFPEGDDRGNNRDAYGLIITNGILETREDFQNRVTKLGALGYYDPTDGFAGDLLQAIFQKFFPSTDWMARRLAEYLATREDPVTVMGYSGGTLTVVNALRRVGRRDNFAVTLRSPVVSYPIARLVVQGVNYNQPWGDISNLLAPSLNPRLFVSGLLDLFCGFCIHRGNNF